MSYCHSVSLRDFFLRKKHIKATLFPISANTFDNLGEANLKDGQIKLAIENYKKSLELNPNNTNAMKILKSLKTAK